MSSPDPYPARVVEVAGATVLVFRDSRLACHAAADRIVQAMRSALDARGQAVLGLATGVSPELIYAHLVEMHREDALSFAGVTTYNLDEYYPISPTDPRSYRAYMQRHLFDHVDLAPNRATSSTAAFPRPSSPSRPRGTTAGSPPTAGSTSSSWGSAATATSASTNPRTGPSRRRCGCRPGWWTSTRSPAPTPPANSATRPGSSPTP